MNETQTQQGIVLRLNAISRAIEEIEVVSSELMNKLRGVKNEMRLLQESYDLGFNAKVPGYTEAGPYQKSRSNTYANGSAVNDRVKRKISAVYVDWCRTGGTLIHKYRFFAQKLNDELPGTTVHRVYRDLASSALPITFHLGDHVKSPAEYWVVSSTFEESLYLFPRPSDARNFRDWSQVFAGGPTAPSQMQGIDPAIVDKAGSSFVLCAPGKFVS